MRKSKIFKMIFLAIPMILVAGCKMGCSSDTTNSTGSQSSNVYSYDLGGGISVLSTFDMQGGEGATSFIPALANQCEGDNNVFIIKNGNEHILIDSGYGDKNPASVVKANYEAFGVDMTNLSTIIMTHLHPDHAAGLTNGSPSILEPGAVPSKKYASAKIYLPKKELDFWIQDTLAPDVASALYYTELDWAGNNTFFAFGSSVVKDMVTAYGADVITFEEASTGTIAGKDFITKMNLFGHTPGHTAYIIRGGNKSMIIAGDFINCARAQFDDTSVSAIYDYNFADAKASRELLMKYAVDNNLVVGSSHAPAPGFMTINGDANTGYDYTMVPISKK